MLKNYSKSSVKKNKGQNLLQKVLKTVAKVKLTSQNAKKRQKVLGKLTLVSKKQLETTAKARKDKIRL